MGRWLDLRRDINLDLDNNWDGITLDWNPADKWHESYGGLTRRQRHALANVASMLIGPTFSTF